MGAANAPILIVEGDADLSAALKELLTEEGFAVETVATPEDAVPLLLRSYYSLVVADYVFGPLTQSNGCARASGRGRAGADRVRDSVERGATRDRRPIRLRASATDRARAAARRRCAVRRLESADPDRARVIARYFDGLGSRDWDAVAALCAPSVRYHLPGSDALSRTIEGREAFRAYTAQTFRAFPKAWFEVTALAWLPHGVVASYRGRWSAPEREAQTVTGDVYFQFRGQEISEIGVRTDVARLRALGAGPGLAAAPAITSNKTVVRIDKTGTTGLNVWLCSSCTPTGWVELHLGALRFPDDAGVRAGIEWTPPTTRPPGGSHLLSTI